MTAYTLPQSLITAFADFENIQKKHLDAFKAGNQLDLQKYIFERSHAFEDLKNRLTEVYKIQKQASARAAAAITAACRERLAYILAMDKLLAGEMNNYRRGLASRLKQMGQGRQAFRGYGKTGAMHAPRFLNKAG